ncbi:MAG: 3-oxoacyl-ACP reductase FabG [Burkholderiaceae bacterium]
MKRALVSGGSGAIGAAICARLAASGQHVIIHANRGAERALAVVEEIRLAGHSAEAAVFDLTDAEATTGCLTRLLEHGTIQTLVHAAGIHDDAPLAGMRAEQWHSVIDVSLNGFFHLCQPLLLPMITTRWGRIVALSSVSGVMGNRGQANYAAAKSGLHGAIRSLAVELGSRGITANAVAPGIIDSPMAEQSFDTERIRSLVPMRRAGRPDEVAALVGFPVSDDAAYISGQVISINGAMA